MTRMKKLLFVVVAAMVAVGAVVITDIAAGAAAPTSMADTGYVACGSAALTSPYTSPPAATGTGTVTTVAAGDNSSLSFAAGSSSANPNTYYFASGTHYVTNPTPLYTATGKITKGSNVIKNLTANPTGLDFSGGQLTVSGKVGAGLNGAPAAPFTAARVSATSWNATTGEGKITVGSTPNSTATGVTIAVYPTYAQFQIPSNVRIVGAPGAIIDGLGAESGAFTVPSSGVSNNVTIEYLTIQHFSANYDQASINPGGVGHFWVLSHDTLKENGGAPFMMGSDNSLNHSCSTSNSQYGFTATEDTGLDSGPYRVSVTYNDISSNAIDQTDILRNTCPPPMSPCANGNSGAGKLWQTTDADVLHNVFANNQFTGVWFDSDNTGADFVGNWVEGSYGVGLFYEVSYNANIRFNTFVKNDLYHGPHNDGFPEGAIFISESGGDSRVTRGTKGYTTLLIRQNVFTDNWNGVVLWENSNRYCHSPATGGEAYYCTLVNPSVANITTCSDPSLITQTPYIDDCRWKTQNVEVHHNTFNFTKANVDAAVAAIGGGSGVCTAATTCGDQAILSVCSSNSIWPAYTISTQMSGSDKTYGGTGAECTAQGSGSVVGTRNLSFHDNDYFGPWGYIVHDTGEHVSRATWQASPFSQDAGSTFAP